MPHRPARSLLALVAISMLTTAGIAPAAALARHGADDPPGHNAGDNHGNGGHGADDGPNHHREQRAQDRPRPAHAGRRLFGARP